MYYPKTKVIFPHIPKTGGSSLEYFIGQVEEPEIYKKLKNKRHMTFLNALYKKHTLEDKGRRPNIHRPAQMYRFQLGDELYDSCYSFSFLRNPFSQIKSLYTMTHKDITSRGKKYPSWEDYIWDDNSPHSIRGQAGNINQLLNISDTYDNDRIIVDELFPFEHYEEAVRKLGKKLNFTPDINVRLWSTKPEHNYTPEMMEKVMDLYGDSYNIWKKVKSHWEQNKTPYGTRRKKSGSSSPR